MKKITIAAIALNLGCALMASAAPKPACSYAGKEKPFFAALNNQLRTDILALKEKGVPVVDASITAKMTVYESGKKNEPITLVVSGGFRSESGTTFSLELHDYDLDHDQNGIIPIGPLENYIVFYPEIDSKTFDPEGNPVNGQCNLNSHGDFTVRNKQTGVVIAKFPSLPKFFVK
jgi:hypothetical protein